MGFGSIKYCIWLYIAFFWLSVCKSTPHHRNIGLLDWLFVCLVLCVAINWKSFHCVPLSSPEHTTPTSTFLTKSTLQLCCDCMTLQNIPPNFIYVPLVQLSEWMSLYLWKVPVKSVCLCVYSLKIHYLWVCVCHLRIVFQIDTQNQECNWLPLITEMKSPHPLSSLVLF